MLFFKKKKNSESSIEFDFLFLLQDVFKNVEKEEDEDFELDKIASILQEKGKVIQDRRTRWAAEEAKEEKERQKVT